MATIGSLIVKLGLDSTPFGAAIQNVVEASASMGQRVSAAINGPGQQLNDQLEHSKSALKQVDERAKSYLGTLLKIGGAGAMVGAAVNAAYKVDRAKSDAAGPGNLSGNLADSYDRVTGAVTRTYEAFGNAFAKSAGLAGVLDTISNILTNLTPLFEGAGTAIGTVTGWLSSSTPLTFALIVAMKLLAVTTLAAAAAGLYLVKSFIIGSISKALFGATPMVLAFRGALLLLRYTIISVNAIAALVSTLISGITLRMVAARVATLAWAAAMAIAKGAMTIVTVAVYALNTAIAILAAISAPVWIAIGIAVIAVVAAFLLLKAAWDWLTGSGGAVMGKLTGIAESLGVINKAGKEAEDAVKKLEDAFALEAATAGMTEQQKKLDEYQKALEKLADLSDNPDAVQSRLRDAEALQKQAEAGKNHATVLEDLKKLETETARAGMSELEQKVDKYRELGASAEELGQAYMLLAKEQQNKDDLEARKDVVKAIADIEKQTAQATMTANQRIVDDYRRRNVSAEQLAELENKLNEGDKKKAAAETLKNLTQELADLERDAANAGLSSAQQKVALMKEQLATADQIARAQAAADRIDAVAQRKKDVDLAARITEHSDPLEKYKKQVEDIQRLLRVGAISSRVADGALAAADKTFKGDLDKGNTGKQAGSPQALLAGSAELALARNRAQNPINDLTKAQRDQLAEQKRLKIVADQQLAAIKANKPQPEHVVNF
jgi:virulence-associated protein VapD